MFKVGDKVTPTREYIQYDGLTSKEQTEILNLVGRVIEAFEHPAKGNIYHVQFENPPYYPDYWIMYESEIGLAGGENGDA